MRVGSDRGPVGGFPADGVEDEVREVVEVDDDFTGDDGTVRLVFIYGDVVPSFAVEWSDGVAVVFCFVDDGVDDGSSRLVIDAVCHCGSFLVSDVEFGDAVYRLDEEHDELRGVHAEHRRRLFELLGIECSLASQSFADGFLAHAEFLGERGLSLSVIR